MLPSGNNYHKKYDILSCSHLEIITIKIRHIVMLPSGNNYYKNTTYCPLEIITIKYDILSCCHLEIQCNYYKKMTYCIIK